MKTTFCILFVGLFGCAAVWGQATAQMHGAVQDATGAAIIGAEVKATQTETSAARSVATGADGSYVLTNLPVGPYLLEVSKEGFTTSVQSGIVLQVNADPVIDATLRVGSVTEQVKVEANTTQVETRSSGIGEVVQTQRIVDLPLNGRNVSDLITLSGVAVNTGNTAQRFFANPEISIAGQPSTALGGAFGTDYLMDGANHLDYITGSTMAIPFPDAVQEFKVESSGQTAQRGSSASVSVVTRSGTNELHGDLFEFIRNNGFGSSREFFSTNSGLKRNQFGGTVGGRIIKNKLFIFGGMQATTIRQNAGNSVATVPTAAMVAGNWSTFASPQCQGRQITLAAPFTNNQISPSLYSAPAMFIVNKLETSLALNVLTPSPCGQVTYNTPDKENDFQIVSKLDYQVSDKQSMFFRSLHTPTKIFNSASLQSPADFNLLTYSDFGSGFLAHSYAYGDTYVISPTLVQSFRASFERTSGFKTVPNDIFDFCDAGVQIYCGGEPDAHWLGSLTVSGGISLTTGGGGTPNGFTNNTYSLNDDLGYVKGSHQMTFGFGALRGELFNVTSGATGGTFTFNGSLTGLGTSDFFLGLPSAFSQGREFTVQDREYSVNLYFTDSWRVSSHLTFNYGVRWEPFLPMTITNNQISFFDMNRFLQGVHSTVFVNGPVGFYFPGDPGTSNQAANRQWDHFDPRGGLAWDPKGDGKTSVRAGYAFGYAYLPGLSRQAQEKLNPWAGTTTVVNPQSFTNPYGNVPGGDPLPYSVTKNVIFPAAGDFFVTPSNLPTPNTYSWNISAQRQITSTWLASVTYIGTRVMHLYDNVPLNYEQIVGPPSATCPGTASPATCSGTGNGQARRILSLLNPAQGQLIGNVTTWDPSGTQRYNGLLSSIQKRFSRNFSMNANWTWSHCITTAQAIDTTAATTVTAPGNPQFDHGNCDIDRRHIVNITAVAQTPRFSNTTLRRVGSNWQLAGIYKFTSGQPFSVLDGTDRELTGIANQRPNVLADPYSGQSGPRAQYLNPAAFQAQPLGTVGNAGYNSLVGPTYWDIDLALSRQFPITERQRIEIRADAFNFTNSFIAAINTTTVSGTAIPASFNTITSGTFGQFLNSQPARQIQFAMKYTF